jgi:hypothetical protein
MGPGRARPGVRNPAGRKARSRCSGVGPTLYRGGMDWIDVLKERPDRAIHTAVCRHVGATGPMLSVEAAYFDPHHFERGDGAFLDRYGAPLALVTHWFPLPEPPR